MKMVEPLKNKLRIHDCGEHLNNFLAIDIKSAVEWLKQNIEKNIFEVEDGEDLEYIFDCIDEAFQDVKSQK